MTGQKNRLLGTLLLVSFSFALGSKLTAQSADERYDLWIEYQCHICHDHQGYAKASAATNPLAGTRLPFEAFAALVRYPANQMPPFSQEQLSNEKLRTIWEYVRAQPESPEVEDVPVLREWLEALE